MSGQVGQDHGRELAAPPGEELLEQGLHRSAAPARPSSIALTFNGAITQTGTDSYRLAHTKALAEQAAAN